MNLVDEAQRTLNEIQAQGLYKAERVIHYPQ
jgi:hypothetical protein